MRGKSKAVKAQDKFDLFYTTEYNERWPALKKSMMEPSRKVAMWNTFTKCIQADVIKECQLELISGMGSLSVFTGPLEIMKPPKDERGVPAFYLLDFASAIIATQLDVQGSNRVLDLCASPGGKSIAITQHLGISGSLTSNEVDRERLARLTRNLKEHVPNNSVPWQVTQRDGMLWHQPEGFDRVLVDAPCSSERHILQQQLTGDMTPYAQWDTKVISQMQMKLLLRAIETVKCGGRVVYSTCSISPFENDGVVKEAIRRSRASLTLVPPQLRIGEATECGWLILPDVCDGWGPMYCAIIEKTDTYKDDSEDGNIVGSSDEESASEEEN